MVNNKNIKFSFCVFYVFNLTKDYYHNLTTDQEVWGSNPYECTKAASTEAAFLLNCVFMLRAKAGANVFVWVIPPADTVYISAKF